MGGSADAQFTLGSFYAEGKRVTQDYAEAAKWKMNTAIPARLAKMTVSKADPKSAPKLIFASVDAAVTAGIGR